MTATEAERDALVVALEARAATLRQAEDAA